MKKPINLNQVVNIINLGLKKTNFNFTIPPISVADISIGNGYVTIISGPNPYEQIFGTLAKNRIKNGVQFTHFKSLLRATEIISKKEIQVSNLTSNKYNDYAEFTEFMRRAEFYHSLIPKDYCTQIQNNQFNPGSPCPADDVRDNTFILCFSQDYKNPKFWSDYAKNDTGVAIVFRFKNFTVDHYDKYDLRDVYYDNGYDFDFINFINFHLRNEFGIAFIPGSVSKFARFYKRQSYNWEKETRLCMSIDSSLPYNLGLGAGHLLSIQKDPDPLSNRQFVILPLENNISPNPFFTLTIDEVIVGKNATPTELSSITNALKINFPNAKIMQRK